MDKTTELNTLYEIRGVMSILSKNADEVSSLQKIINTRSNEICEQKEACFNPKTLSVVTQQDAKVKELEENKMHIERDLWKTTCNIDKQIKRKNDSIKNRRHWWVYALIGLLPVSLTGGALLPLGIIFLIGFLVANKSTIKDAKKQIEKETLNKQNLEKELDENNNQIYLASNDHVVTEKINNAKNAFERERNERITKNKTFIEEAKKEIVPFVQNSKLLYEEAVEKYKNFLSPYDWENVDLIIFYFQTGRALTMKEALYQVDRQRQTDQIVKAIQSVGSNLCTTIKNSCSMISHQIRSGFIKLSQDVENLNKTVLSSNQTQELLMRDILDESKVNNVIQEKANVTSLQLANDINYIRQREEYREIRS